MALALLLGLAVGGAQGPSPFDLIPRLDPSDQRAALGLPDTSNAARAPVNPLDIVRDGRGGAGGDRGVSGPAVRRPSTLGEVRRDRVPGVGRGASRTTFDAVLTFGLLVLLSVTFLLQGGVLRRMLAAAFNPNRLARLLREQQRSGFLVWAFLGALTVAAYAYASLRYLHPEWLSGRWMALDAFMLTVIALTLLKLGALELLKVAFPLDKPLGRYQMLILVFLAGAGLLAFPLLVLVNFAPAGLAEVLAHAALPLLGVALALRSLSAAATAGPLLAKYPLHFLLYLCALEIGPLLILYRVVASGLVPGST